MVGSRIKLAGVLVVALLLFGAGTVVGVSINPMSFDPLEAGQGAVADSSLTIDSERLVYSGLDATKAKLEINNTDSVDHDANVSLELVNSSGGTVASASKTGQTFTNNTVTTVTLDFEDTNVTKFSDVQVRIEETG